MNMCESERNSYKLFIMSEKICLNDIIKALTRNNNRGIKT